MRLSEKEEIGIVTRATTKRRLRIFLPSTIENLWVAGSIPAPSTNQKLWRGSSVGRAKEVLGIPITVKPLEKNMLLNKSKKSKKRSEVYVTS